MFVQVHNPDIFVNKIMKSHFQQTKYKSFQRQLNLWGFERNTKETVERGSYYHPLFIRGRKDLCQQMGRQKATSPIVEAAIKEMSARVAAAEKPSDSDSVSAVVTPSLPSSRSSPKPYVMDGEDLKAMASVPNHHGASTLQPDVLAQVVSGVLAAEKQRHEQQKQNSEFLNYHALLHGRPEATSSSQLVAALLNNPPPSIHATNAGMSSSSVIDALRLKGTHLTSSAGGTDSLDMIRQALLGGGGTPHYPQSHLAQYLPSNPPPTAATKASIPHMDPYGGMDADILHTLKRRMSAEQILRGQQPTGPASAVDLGALTTLLSGHHHHHDIAHFHPPTNPPPSAFAAMDPLAKADAEVIQALKRRATIEQILRGQQPTDTNTSAGIGSLGNLLSSFS